MTISRTAIFRILTAIVFLFVCVSVSQASIFSSKKRYYVAANDSIFDDLYLGTSEGVFEGVIDGDILIGSEKYIISGTVTGNVISFSQYATIRGTINQSARVFAQTVDIDGTIGNNLLTFASIVDISRGSRVEKDVNIFGGQISVGGYIGRDLSIKGGRVIISGIVEGDLIVEAENISIVEPAEIKGNIFYESEKEIQIAEGTVVAGEIEWTQKEAEEDDDGGIDIIWRLVFFLATLLNGLIIIAVTKRHVGAAVDQVVKRPLVCIAVGFVASCVALVAFFVLLVTIIGIPSAIILLFTYTIFFYVAKIYVAIAAGQIIIRAFRKGIKPKIGWSLILGMIAVSIGFALPYIGWLIYLLTVLWGLGAILLGIRECRWDGAAAVAQVSSEASPPPPNAQ